MSSPIYFFPAVRLTAIVQNDRFRESFLRDRGVAGAFDGIRDVSAQVSCFELSGTGPGGHSGVLLQHVGNPAPLRIGFHPSHQTWHERPAGCDAWVGIDNEYPPTPAELAKGRLLKGHDVELGDGNIWRVPIVRSPLHREALGRSQLPRDFCYDQDGAFQVVRRQSHAELWELSGVLWDHCFDRDRHPTIEFSLAVDLILGALSLSYRIGRPEQQILKLVNSENWSAAVEAILDAPLVHEMIEMEKKTLPDPAPDSSIAWPGAAE